MDGQRRRELADSLRLAVRGERWFLLDVVLAVVGFVGWVAATGALVALGAREAGVSIVIEQGSRQTLGILAAGVVGWLVLPAIAGAWRVRDRVTTQSGYVDKDYRIDSPATLLAPPFAVVLLAAVAVVAAPLKWPAFALAFVASAFLLVWTLAFSYRVFSLSYPQLIHVASFWTFLLYAVVGVTQLASFVGSEPMLTDAIGVLGLPIDLNGTVGAGPVTLPVVLTAAAATPVVLVIVYLGCQSIVATYVLRTEPVIEHGTLRTGQRNPFESATANGAGVDVGQQNRTGARETATGEQPKTPVHVQTTRVYAPDDHVTDPAGVERAPTSRAGQQCRTCGAAFTSETEVRFCPNCGQRLDDG